MGERRMARLTIGGAVSRHALAEALDTPAGCQLDECLEDERVVVEDPRGVLGRVQRARSLAPGPHGPGDRGARTDHLDAGRAMPPLSDTEALNRIHECLNGLEWSAETLAAIAALVEATGRPIAPPPLLDRR